MDRPETPFVVPRYAGRRRARTRSSPAARSGASPTSSPATAASGPSSRPIPELVRHVPVDGDEPRRRHPRGPRPARRSRHRDPRRIVSDDDRHRRRARGRLGRARPGQPRPGRPGPRDPGPRLLRAGLVAVRRRSAADRTSRRSTPCWRSPSRTSAGSTSARAPVAMPCRSPSASREVIAVEPSASMRERAAHRQGGARARERPDRRRAPGRTALETLGEPPVADVALDRPRRLRHRGDRAVPRRRWSRRRKSAVRRDADRPQPGVGRRPVLAARPRHGARAAAGPAGAGRVLLRARGRTTEIQRVERPPRTFDSFDGARHVRPPPAVDRRGRREGAALPGRPCRDRPASATTTAGPWRPAGRLDRDHHLGSPLGRLTGAKLSR